jgi:PAS domain S-box-containing protein
LSPHLHHQIAAVESLDVGLCQYNVEEQRAPKNCLSKLVLSVLASLWLLSVVTETTWATTPRRVLILHELGLGSPGMELVDHEIVSAVTSLPYQVELYSEHLETALFSDEASQDKFADWYLRKYRDRKPDVIVVVGPSPLRFMLNSHERFLPDTPVLFCESAEEMLGGATLPPHFTGVWGVPQPGKTLGAALRLQPSTRHVFVVGGVAPYDRYLEALVKERFRSYESSLEFTYLTDLDMPALLERIKHLPSHSIVYHTSIMEDAAGNHFIDATQSAPMVANAANAPVFVIDDVDVGGGTVGGDVFSFASEGRETAKMLLRVLNGEKPQDIPVVRSANQYLFDWRAVRRWGFKESDLPHDSVVLNRQPAAFRVYGRYILAALLVCVGQTVLIVALLRQRTKKRRIEKSLAERLAFETFRSELSATFVNLSEAQVASKIGEGLGRIAEFLAVDRITLFECSQKGADLTATSTWSTGTSEPIIADSKPIPWPWWTSRGLSGITFGDGHMPPEETVEVRRYLLESGIQSIASVPLRIGGEIVGAISFVSTTSRLVWTEQLVKKLKVLAEIFSHALKRKRAMEVLTVSQAVLRESEERLRLAIEAGKLGGWEWDLKTGRSFWFGESHAQIGMSRLEGHPENRQDFWDRVHPEDRERLTEAVESAKQFHTEFDQEFRCVWADGTEHWLRSTGKFFYGPDGEAERLLGVSRDITPGKQSEQALKQRETDFRDAQRIAKVGSWQWDPSTDTVEWSEELYRIAGLDPGMPAVSYKDHGKIYTPESWERLQAAVMEALRAGTPYELDLEMIRLDGERRWLTARGEAHHDSHGHVVQLRGTVQDITERKKIVEALRESEARLRFTQDNAHVGAFEWDMIKNESFQSPEMERIYGVEPGSFGAGVYTWMEHLHPDDRKRMECEVREHVRRGGTADSEFRIIRPSGEVRWLFSRGHVFSDSTNSPIRIVGIAIDITERKRAAEALRESEERFRIVANTAPVMIWMSGPDKLCTYFNQPWLEFTGRPLEAELGNGWAEGVHPEDFANCWETYSKAFDRRQNFQIEYRLRRHDGEYRWILDMGVPQFKSDQTFAGYIGSGIDVTERKVADEALSSISRRLIEAHEEERTRIARELHDDINQRLALLEIELEQVDTTSVGLPASLNLQAFRQRLSEVASDVQAISHRLHSSKLEYLGLASAIRSFCKELSERQKVKIKFICDSVPGTLPPEISLCLFRVAQEALLNCVKHSGVREFDVDLREVGEQIQLSVSDSGVGFDLTKAAIGPGLGLISMHERVRLIKGAMSIRSEPMKGTTIQVFAHLGTPLESAKVARKAG